MASTMLETGPAKATIAMPTSGPFDRFFKKPRVRLRGLTGTGLAQPMGGIWASTQIKGSAIVHMGSTWSMGLKVKRP